MDNVLQACSDELDKIAESAELKRSQQKLKQTAIGAALGVASTVPFYAPLHLALHKAGRNKANLALLAFNVGRGAAYGTILGGLMPTRSELRSRYKSGQLISGSKSDMKKLHQQAKSWMPKRANAFGKNVGKSFGRTSSKGGFSTSFKSAGMGDMKSLTKSMPKLPGVSTKTPGIKPPKAISSERNNQVNLRRGLSNVQIAGGV
jgi:hypothetical protein